MDHTASYSPEDNKVRIYPASRLSKEDYEHIRAVGFRWAPKQKIFVCPAWSPTAEDAALDLCDEIGDEDQPRAERAVDRADRFEGYMHKREDEAVNGADRFEVGPAIHANQSRARAERSARRHDRIAGRACTQWGKAEYWQSRTAGVIANALHLERPDVRHRRIKGLESDLARLEAQYSPLDSQRSMQQAWQDGRDSPEVPHVLCGQGRDRHWVKESSLMLIKAGSERRRAHLAMRLAYEQQMLAAQGGTAANVEMVAGGWIGKHQIQKVTKDRAGRVSKVYFLAPNQSYADRQGRRYGDDYPAPMTLHAFSAERIKPGDYREPTAVDMATLTAAKPKIPLLVNYMGDGFERLTKAEYDRKSRCGMAHTKVIDGARIRHVQIKGWQMVPVFISDLPVKSPRSAVSATESVGALS